MTVRLDDPAAPPQAVADALVAALKLARARVRGQSPSAA